MFGSPAPSIIRNCIGGTSTTAGSPVGTASFERDPDFDIYAYWQATSGQFVENVAVYIARLRGAVATQAAAVAARYDDPSE
ncbi:MAG: hypothetical protein ACOCYT_05835 [Chloroflexota bacterium]